MSRSPARPASLPPLASLPPAPACPPALQGLPRPLRGPTRRLALGAALGLAGCSILPQRPYLRRRDWPLTAPRPDPLPPRLGGKALLVRDVVAAPGLDVRGLQLLQPDGSLRTEFYEAWDVPPADGVAEALRRWLAASGLFGAVLAPGSRLHADLVLEAELTQLVAVPAQGVARAALVVVLLAQSGTTRLVLQRTLHAQAPLAGDAAPAMAGALLAALSGVLAQTEQAVAPFA